MTRKSSSDPGSSHDLTLCLGLAEPLQGHCSVPAASVMCFCLHRVLYFSNSILHREYGRYSIPLNPNISVRSFCACECLVCFQRAERAPLPPRA